MIILLIITMYTLVKNCIALTINREPDFHGKYILTHFKPMFYFYISKNISKFQGLCMFSGAQEMKQWFKMG